MTTDIETAAGTAVEQETLAAQPPGRRGLWRHSDFNKLWLGQTVSVFGSQVTLLALPLTAVVYLNASATAVGLMVSARDFAVLALMLFFGVLVDRMRRKPLMVTADLVRVGLLGVIPILVWTGSLGMPVLYVVAFLLGCFTVVFDLSYRSYLPSVVSEDALLAGNSRLQLTESVSEVAGPGLGGVLVQVLRAPFALLVDAASFLFSAALLLLIKTPEPSPKAAENANRGLQGVFGEIGAGLKFTLGHKMLRPIAGAAAVFNFFAQIMLTLFVIYATRVLHMSGGEIGLVFAGFGVGGVVAAMSLDKFLGALGYGRLLLVGYVVGAAAIVSLPFVFVHGLGGSVLLLVVFFVAGVGIVSLNIVEMTLRQVATPNSVQGRVNASFRFLVGALLPISAAVAGVLGDHLGLRATLFVVAVGIPFSLLLLVFSPVRHVKTLDELEPQEA